MIAPLGPGQGPWLSTIRRYLAVALHCTGGDILIATSALLAALFLLGSSQWPEVRYRRVGLAAIVIGLGYRSHADD